MIKETQPRQTVQVRFPDGRAFDGPAGTSAEAFIAEAQPAVKGDVVACLVNGSLRELSEPISQDTELTPLTTGDSDGGRIYRRSLSFLLIAAFNELYPDAKLNVQHSLPFGGYYCEPSDATTYTPAELEGIKHRMRELVAADLPINRIQLPLEEALELFRAQGDEDALDLSRHRRVGVRRAGRSDRARSPRGYGDPVRPGTPRSHPKARA